MVAWVAYSRVTGILLLEFVEGGKKRNGVTRIKCKVT